MVNYRYPNFPNKHIKDSIVNPKEFIDYMSSSGLVKCKPPRSVILCYDFNLLSYIKQNYDYKSYKGFFSKLKFLSNFKDEIAFVGGFGVGSPSASNLIENLIAFGVKKFISIGTAGSIQENIKIGDLVVCTKAIRDEGTSHHYLKPEKYSYPSKILTEKLILTLEKLNIKYHLGTSWTTDAPYRETKEEIMEYKKEGVATVEMEAAALFAVASYRKVEICSLLTISDSLSNLKWSPHFLSEKTINGLQNIFKAAISCCTQ